MGRDKWLVVVYRGLSKEDGLVPQEIISVPIIVFSQKSQPGQERLETNF